MELRLKNRSAAWISSLSCTAKRSNIPAVRDFYKDDVNEEQLHNKSDNFWQAMI